STPAPPPGPASTETSQAHEMPPPESTTTGASAAAGRAEVTSETEITVRDPAGALVAGAHVALYRDVALSELDRAQLVGEGLTSDAGTLVFAGTHGDPLAVAASKPEVGECVVRSIAGASIGVQLRASHAIDGLVVDADGEPIASALVR